MSELEVGNWGPSEMKRGQKGEEDEPTGHDAATATAATDNNVEFLRESAHGGGLRQ